MFIIFTSIPWAVTSAGLKMPSHAHFIWHPILTHKVGQTDLVVGVRSWFISRFAHARLHVSCVQRWQFVPPWLTPRQTQRLTAFWPADRKSSASWAKNSYSESKHAWVISVAHNWPGCISPVHAGSDIWHMVAGVVSVSMFTLSH